MRNLTSTGSVVTQGDPPMTAYQAVFEGTVVDEEGKAIPNAEVEVDLLGPDGTRASDTTATNALGRLRVTGTSNRPVQGGSVLIAPRSNALLDLEGPRDRGARCAATRTIRSWCLCSHTFNGGVERCPLRHPSPERAKRQPDDRSGRSEDPVVCHPWWVLMLLVETDARPRERLA